MTLIGQKLMIDHIPLWEGKYPSYGATAMTLFRFTSAWKIQTRSFTLYGVSSQTSVAML